MQLRQHQPIEFFLYFHTSCKQIHWICSCSILTIYKNKELNEVETQKYIKQTDGISYDVYNLEMIIAVAFRICSRESILFRKFVVNEINATKKEAPITLFVSCSRGSNRWYS